ncbi:hypothetical protein BURMUCF1_0892 [Burkholderia multivorans ATCC BAA-247]|nr:hypothetical protein BURMUCF1_0892 [Burkholderia multivorans ATCC BAA-247]
MYVEIGCHRRDIRWRAGRPHGQNVAYPAIIARSAAGYRQAGRMRAAIQCRP